MKAPKSDAFARRAFWVAAPLLVVGASFLAGVYSADRKNIAYRAVQTVKSEVKQVLHELPGQLDAELPETFIRPSRKPGAGVTVNQVGADGQLVLLTSFFDGQTGIRLMRRDGTVVADWPVPLSRYITDLDYVGNRAPKTDRNVDIHGAVIEPDGSVTFNYEYVGTVRISRCGDPIWTLHRPGHHSVERAAGGGFWIPGRRYFPAGSPAPEDQFPPFTLKQPTGEFSDDTIQHVSEDGRVIEEHSIMRLLYDSGLEPVLTATGESFRAGERSHPELLHVNKIGELPPALAPAFPMFEAGDLLISFRKYNMLAVVDPDTWRVKWHQTGPWRRQHDPEFLPNGQIGLFNNNTYHNSLNTFDRYDPKAPFVTEVGMVDPATGRYTRIYGDRPDEEMLSVIRGKIDPTPDGGFLITEFEAGRAFQIDASGKVVWEYINRFNDDYVLKITEARLYPESYFTVTDWICPEKG